MNIQNVDQINIFYVLSLMYKNKRRTNSKGSAVQKHVQRYSS